MGYAIYYDPSKERFSGYEVPAPCEQPKCKTEIDRGIERICGDSPGGGEFGCGLAFCDSHMAWPESEDGNLPRVLCERCIAVVDDGAEFNPHPKKPDLKEWTDHLATDASWAEWREQQRDNQ